MPSYQPLNRMKKVLTAQAEAEKIRRIGEAEAGSIEAIGKAEAEKMRLKAEAYQHYGDAAKTALVLEALPKVSVSRHGHLTLCGKGKLSQSCTQAFDIVCVYLWT